MARFERLHAGRFSAREIGFQNAGVPNQVERFATGMVVFNGGAVTANDTITIGGVTYTVVADPTAVSSTDTAVYVDLGASVSAQATALAAAINATGASATTYASKANGDNIKPNPAVTAHIGFGSAAGDAVVVCARKPGVGGNSIVFTESADNTVNYQIDGSTVATTLTGGIDGNNLLDSENYTNLSLRNTNAECPQAEGGGAAAATVNTSNTFLVKGVPMYQYNSVAQDITHPVGHAKGLSIGGDQTENDALEISFGAHNTNSKHAYIPARDGEVKFRAKINIEDVSGADAFLVGWRKVEAGKADPIANTPNGYDQLVAFNIVSGDVKGSLKFNDGNVDTDDLANNWADNETHDLELIVDQGGNVTLLIDGAAPSTAHAGTLKFNANEEIAPFIYILQDANLTLAYLEEIECGPIPRD